MIRRATSPWILLLACALVLSGCCGNGWPYGADGGTCASNASRAPGDSNTDVPTHSYPYYWLDDTYTCTNSVGAAIASDRGYLQQTGESDWQLYGDRCARARGAAPTKLHTADLPTSRIGLQIFGFGPGIFQSGGFTDITLVWCQGVSTDDEALVTFDKNAGKYRVIEGSHAYDVNSYDATRTLGASSVRFANGTDLRLDVELATSASDPNRHDGTLHLGSMDINVLCRMTHP